MHALIFEGVTSLKTNKRLEEWNVEGEIHSLFNHTANIVLNRQLPNMITLGDSSVLGAPNSMTVTNFPELRSSLSIGQKCRLEGNKLFFDSRIEIGFTKKDGLDPLDSFVVNSFDPWLLKERIGIIRRDVQSRNPYIGHQSYLPFYKQVNVESQAFVEAIVSQNWEEVERRVHRLIGLGVGLTPAGDDYLTGILLATLSMTDLHQNISKMVIGNNLKGILQTNAISQHQLYFAVQGEGKLCVMNLIRQLLATDSNFQVIEALIDEVMMIGSTSGFDMLTGVLDGLEILIRSKENKVYDISS